MFDHENVKSSTYDAFIEKHHIPIRNLQISSRPASIARYFEASTEQKGEQWTREPTGRGTEISRVQRLQWSSFGSEKQ